ncbi:uncharacterized protein LOC127288078 [Leptopilina boulardi]|uniref:uncharacterized protein LOC127288078 n=1 Tax=Leptopilina boulardi TaxID=63433 RepID=UPI0021F53A1E|nr:uncharacterized protein LOC127288078 [Leptopilina boulardi]
MTMTIFCFLILLLSVSSISQIETSDEDNEQWDNEDKFYSEEKCDDSQEFLIDAAWTSDCDVTCDTLFGRDMNEKNCKMGIFPRCICRPGFIRRNTNGKCIHPLDCDNNPNNK